MTAGWRGRDLAWFSPGNEWLWRSGTAAWLLTRPWAPPLAGVEIAHERPPILACALLFVWLCLDQWLHVLVGGGGNLPGFPCSVCSLAMESACEVPQQICCAELTAGACHPHRNHWHLSALDLPPKSTVSVPTPIFLNEWWLAFSA